MGRLEKLNIRKMRRTKLQEAVVRTLALHDRLAASAIIPEALNYLFDLNLPSHSRRKEIVRSAVSRLRKYGLVDFKNGFYSLSDTGLKKLQKWEGENYQIAVPKKWDGKWRIVIFDIPEKKRTTRTRVRGILHEAGFKMLQDSVWVIPYDCEDVIGLMKTDLGVGKYLLYIIADQIENDKHLRIDFGLL